MGAYKLGYCRLYAMLRRHPSLNCRCVGCGDGRRGIMALAEEARTTTRSEELAFLC